ncbi:MAG TPA: glycosyltransferase, partial [Planctomycetia bacterium]|nr:glycosyltransferase [Planctomycetia bacterium]
MTAPRRVLMIGAHFPPDTSAGTHRLRLLAPHLPAHGWEPTVLTVDPRDYESRLDEGLAALVPENLRVIRCRAWSARTTRRFGFGDLGLRALRGLCRAADKLLASEPFDAFFITIYPSYVALVGPSLKKRHRLPFVLDYQDPWVGSWGKTVGGGPGGAPDLRSRASLRLAKFLEPRAARAADALVAVSQRTLDEVIERNPALAGVPTLELPIGGEPADFEALRRAPRPNPHFNPADGDFHVCYVGTLLPLGFETLRAVFAAACELKESAPDVYRRLRLRFFGTSNQTAANSPSRALPVAAEYGVADRVTEVAPRLDYLDALAVQTQASALLLMGSSERHYT